mmetsp:Transcript_2724/g.4200  ORF Transcript_2724/g.4200 Transcript_2724/m.4200 type:complete len:217 (-) Transcript_2724:694-1344(-)
MMALTKFRHIRGFIENGICEVQREFLYGFLRFERNNSFLREHLHDDGVNSIYTDYFDSVLLFLLLLLRIKLRRPPGLVFNPRPWLLLLLLFGHFMVPPALLILFRPLRSKKLKRQQFGSLLPPQLLGFLLLLLSAFCVNPFIVGLLITQTFKCFHYISKVILRTRIAVTRAMRTLQRAACHFTSFSSHLSFFAFFIHHLHTRAHIISPRARGIFLR